MVYLANTPSLLTYIKVITPIMITNKITPIIILVFFSIFYLLLRVIQVQTIIPKAIITPTEANINVGSNVSIYVTSTNILFDFFKLSFAHKGCKFV